MRIVVAGVAGSGKSTVGSVLAERLDAVFVDGDALHPVANIAKISARFSSWTRHGPSSGSPAVPITS